MINTIPSKDEMRILIKNIFETANKLKGNIQINSLDDAAKVAAYFYGYSSWKEYLTVYKNEERKNQKEEFLLKIPKFTSQNYKKNDIFLKNIPKKVEMQKSPITPSNFLPLEWLIGKKRNVLAKIDEPVGLLSEDYIVTSNMIDYSSNLLIKKIKWLNQHQQTFFLFGTTDKLMQGLLKENALENTIKIGKGTIKFDPIEESFEGDGFESLLDINPIDENQMFPWIWTMIVRTLREQLNMKWSVQLLIDSLELKNLIKINELMISINPLLIKPLQQYLHKQCQIVIDENDFTISEEGQTRHYLQSYLIKEKLEKLKLLYQEGYFSENSKMTIEKCVNEKKSVIFLDCQDDKMKKSYWEACSVIYLNAIKKQNNVIHQFDKKEYQVWSLWWEADTILSNNFSIDLMENNYSNIVGLYILSANHKLDKCFDKIKQIIFLRQQYSHYPENWTAKALRETEFWEYNLWLDNFGILKKLEMNQAFIWKPKTLLVPDGTEYYEFKKIELYKINEY